MDPRLALTIAALTVAAACTSAATQAPATTAITPTAPPTATPAPTATQAPATTAITPTAPPTATPAATRSLTPTIAAAPVNDSPPGLHITAVPYADSTNTSRAQIHATEPGSCGSGGYSVWYSFAPAVDQVVVADTLGSEYETIINIWTGSLTSDYQDPGFENLTPLACSASSGVVFAAQVGVNYVIRISSTLNSTGGHLVFNLAPG